MTEQKENSQQLKPIKKTPKGEVIVPVDSELARALGHKAVRYEPGKGFVVHAESAPASND